MKVYGGEESQLSGYSLHRAGGNGTAGTAIAILVFEGEKWRHLDFNLCVRYRMASPSGLP